MKKKVLITNRVHPLLIDGLEEMGFDVEYDTSVTLSNLPSKISELDGIVINSKIIMDKVMIDAGKKLSFIARLGSGLEIIDCDYARVKGVSVINSPEGNRDAVAEHAIGMLLCLKNNLIQSNSQVKSFEWKREMNRGVELMGKTLGIVGFGNTGTRMALKLANWGMNIIYHDISNGLAGQIPTEFRRVDRKDILKYSDVITFHLPLTKYTKDYVDKEFIDGCKDKVILVNTSRGNVINTQALIDALKSGKVGGACLDVFENEKPETYSAEEYSMYKELFEFENVIVSPHVAGWTHESLEKIARIVLEKIGRLQ